jgi:hypothetical protein
MVGRRNRGNVYDHGFKGGIGDNILNALLQSVIDNLNNKKAMSFGSSCLIVGKNPPN